MDTNNDIDIDSLLLQQFSSMATQDREVLIADFKNLLGDKLNNDVCSFYLDMNNWNLQAAVCSYFEYEQQEQALSIRIPMMSLVRDEAIQDQMDSPIQNRIVPPNTTFCQTWRIMNTGLDPWPVSCSLRFIDGEQMTRYDRVLVNSLHPNSSSEVSVMLTSPAESGIYEARWRMSTITGTLFGEPLHVSVHVCNDPRLWSVIDDTTTQMSSGMTEMCDVVPMLDAAAAGLSQPMSLYQQTLTSHPITSSTVVTANGMVPDSEMDSMEMS